MERSNVWDDRGYGDMTRGAFYLVVGCILAWGFVLTKLMAQMTAGWEVGIFELLLVGLGIPIVGIFMSFSRNALVAVLGFNLVVGGLAAILGPLLHSIAEVQPGLIERAAVFTALTTAVMAVSGLLFPDFYRSIGGALLGALTALVAVSIARLFIPAIQEVGVIDYISAVIFSLYIGYDMYRASEIRATLSNAVNVATALYLDIINLFLDFLRIIDFSSDGSGSSGGFWGSDGGFGGDGGGGGD